MINQDTVIDMDWLKSATFLDLKEVMKLGGEKLSQVNALLATREGAKIASDMINDPDYVPVSKRQPTPEETALIEVDKQKAEQQAAEAAEAQRLEAEQKAAKEAEAVKAPVKKVLAYQVTDEATGKPLGRPTHIEYTTEEELVEKMKAAHVNAVRYADRIKRGRVSSVETTAQRETTDVQIQKDRDAVTAEIEAAAKEGDAKKMAEAIRKSNEVERNAEQQAQRYREEGQRVARQWMSEHKDDYLVCDANGQLINQWLKNNGPVVDGEKRPLQFTYDNLELAYEALESQLVKPTKSAPVEAVSVVPANNPPAATPVAAAPEPPSITAPVAVAAETSTTPAAQSSTPAAAAPETTPVAAPNAQQATRRPGVNGSLPPGTLSAQRPQGTEQPTTSTRAELMQEIKKMSGPELRRKIKDANYVKKLEAAGIPVLGLR